MPLTDRASIAALTCLIMIHAVMLMALFAGVEPHPPSRVAPFGMAPFLAVMMSAALGAMILGVFETRAGALLTAVAVLLSLVSFGPHKLFDPALPLIWPALVSAWVSIATLAVRLFASRANATIAT